jgi:hypothetical protein
MIFRFKHHEYWPARLFEFPYYLRIVFGLLRYHLGLRSLLKVNFSLDHGGFAFASKFQIQKAIGENFFPNTFFISKEWSTEEKLKRLRNWISRHAFPVILKPDQGFTGKGVVRVNSVHELENILPLIQIDYLAQSFVVEPMEFGVFYFRSGGVASIFSINEKVIPFVVGDGVSSLRSLAQSHERYTQHWEIFLKEHNEPEVIPLGIVKTLSFIGSHTLGSMFKDRKDLISPALTQAVASIFAKTPGVNFGRLDVKCFSESDLKKGVFKMIEMNGVDSLPTNVFDPKFTLREAYQTFFALADALVKIAHQFRHEKMQIDSLLGIFQKTKRVVREINTQHQVLLNRKV